MRFMIIVKATADSEAGVMPKPEAFEAMGRFNEQLIEAGVLLAGDGLHPSSEGARVTNYGGKLTVVDGPFAETKELIAGYTVIEVGSYQEALEWVKQWPPLDGNGNVQLELRRFVSAEDFGEAFTPDLQAREQALRDKGADGV